MNKPIISIDDIKQALEFRYATKAFDSSKKISQENIELLLEAARLAPSSYGFEPWNIIVVQEDEQLRADVKRCAGANAARFDASHILIFTAKTSEGLLQKGGHIDHMLHDVKKQNSIKAAGFKTFWRYRISRGNGTAELSRPRARPIPQTPGSRAQEYSPEMAVARVTGSSRMAPIQNPTVKPEKPSQRAPRVGVSRI